jgi:predicted nucleic acid-binding protein
MNKIKILLDADVVIDFVDCNQLNNLPRILPDYDFVILDIVMNEELGKHHTTKQYIERQIEWFKDTPNISIIEWKPDLETLRIYSQLLRSKGKGESACMAYCHTHNDILASCNLRDTRKYCEQHDITYITFLDLIWYAWRNKILTEAECNQCINEVIDAGNKIPKTKITEYTPTISNL